MFRCERQVGRLFLGVAFFYGFVATNVAFAQVGTGSIQGTVSDSSGAIIAGASVTVTNTQTSVVAPITANTQGRYVAPDLLVGTYDVQAKMTGFQTQIHTGVVITVGQTVVVDFSLPVGQVTETVTVQGATTQVETTSAEISAQIGQQQVEQLPLNGRNYEQLILLAPGVQTVTTGAQSSFYGREPSYSIAGSRPEGQELLLDGANIQGFWNHGAGNSIIGTSLGVEAIGEFQVLTNSYSARFGGSGSVMNATTRSGTNAFHGRVYDFFRNNAFDARDYFNTTASPMNPYRQNQFGGAVGGPIKKDKLFFFVNYEGIRRLRGSAYFPQSLTRRRGWVTCRTAWLTPRLYVILPHLTHFLSVPHRKRSWLFIPPEAQVQLNCPPVRRTERSRSDHRQCGIEPANEDYVNTRWDYVLFRQATRFSRAMSSTMARW